MGGNLFSKGAGAGVEAVGEKAVNESQDRYIFAHELPPAERAAFSVTSRLLCCIVNEGVLHAVYSIAPSNPHLSSCSTVAGYCIVLSSQPGSSQPTDIDQAVFGVVALHHAPILQAKSQGGLRTISLLDPLDMLPLVFEYKGTLKGLVDSTVLTRINTETPTKDHSSDIPHLHLDPMTYWERLATILDLSPASKKSIESELVSSREWQEYTYLHPPRVPTFDSTSIEWEQSLLEGHPTHPMHRARRATPPMPPVNPGSYDFYNPNIRFVAVPRASLELQGQYEKIVAPLLRAAEENAGSILPYREKEGMIVVPVHELQLSHIEEKVPDAEILGEEWSVAAKAHASLRTLSFPQIPTMEGYALKLALGMKVTSALRTISHWTGDFGPRFSSLVVPHLAIDSSVLLLEKEPGSAVFLDPEPEKVKHFTSVVREAYEDTSVEKEGEKVIVCAALVEGDGGVASVMRVFGLEDDEEKKVEFVRRYIKLILQGVVPPMVVNGVAFEAHPQNMLARFDIHTRQLKGFVIRDLGGLRIHPPTLDASLSASLKKPTTFEFLPGHCIPTTTLEESFKKLYHTLVYNHLQRFLRVVGMHYDGSGWAIMREELEVLVPREHKLWKAWMSEDARVVDGKCLLRMKLDGLYRDHVYHKMPNLIQFRPEEADSENGQGEAVVEE